MKQVWWLRKCLRRKEVVLPTWHLWRNAAQRRGELETGD